MDINTIVDLARQAWVVWLMIIFVAIIFWAYRPKNAKRFEDDANIIFREDDNIAFKDDKKKMEGHHG